MPPNGNVKPATPPTLGELRQWANEAVVQHRFSDFVLAQVGTSDDVALGVVVTCQTTDGRIRSKSVILTAREIGFERLGARRAVRHEVDRSVWLLIHRIWREGEQMVRLRELPCTRATRQST